MEPKFQVQLKIRKPVAEVFDAVVNPAKLTGYFLQTSSGPLAQGATVSWKFAEVEEPFDVVVSQVVENEAITFDWPSEDGGSTRVWMVFLPMDADNTMVQIREGGWPDTPQGDKASHGNAGGWMHMLACLKGYLEYGINLRAGGAF
ncbi:MAG: SRPBCC domain-containing protein [Phenylobacterium sp.]|nr:SRPBCC domain-containing protein [Phenylobacterium sp.]MBP8246382.1 SRPBCC domain-containing protein [Phenylobacterium sp.]